MPECQVTYVLSTFHRVPRLDKFVSGIPNAITNQSPVAENVAAGADLRLPIPEIPIARAHVIAV
jgi:hypothetical protein